MTQLADRPLSFGQIYATSAHLWRVSTVKKIQFLVLLAAVWGVLPFFFVPVFDLNNLMAWLHGVTAYYGLPLVIYLLGLLLFFAAVYYRAASVLANQEVSAADALKVGFKKLLFLVPAAIISGLVLTLGYMAFIVPGIVLQLMLLLYYPLIIVDNLGPIAAFKRCWQLVDGYWWRTLFIIGLPLAVFYGLMIGIDMAAYHLIIRYEPDQEIWLAQYLLRMALIVLFFPFFVTLMLVQIRDLKLRRQSHGQS